MSTPATFDSGQFKANTRAAWDNAAPGWDANTPLLQVWLAEVTDAMLAAAAIGPGHRVLDIAAGAGDQTITIARRVGPHGHVLATDLSPGILRLALRNALQAGLDNVQTKVADAERLDLEGADYDAAICRLGLMFCPDPLAALRGTLAALKPGGRACTLVFSTLQANPCMGILMATALEHAGLTARDPLQPGSLFSLSPPGRIDTLFDHAGFEDVHTTRVPAPMRLPSSQHFLDFIRTSAAPIMQILAPLGSAAQAAAWQEMGRRLDAFQTPAGWEGPNELLLTTGRRPLAELSAP